MAVDEMLFRRCQESQSFPPTLRIYDWSEPAFSIGYFQDIYQTLNVEKTQQEGLKVVRRMTGGRAVLHHSELTYSVVANSSRNPELGSSLAETYRQLSLALARSLRLLGIRAEYKKGKVSQVPARSFYAYPCFSSVSSFELTAKGKKLAGSAQRRTKGYFIQQGSLPRENGDLDINDYLVIPQKDKPNKHSWDEKSTTLSAVAGRKIELPEVKDCVSRGFEEFFGIKFMEERLSRPELMLAFKLEAEKYSQPNWNYGRPGAKYPSQPAGHREQLALAQGCECVNR